MSSSSSNSDYELDNESVNSHSFDSDGELDETIPVRLGTVYLLNGSFDKIIKLDCSCQGIKELDMLPKSLKIIDCSANKLKVLPTLPINLEKLSCSNNSLTTLPTLPETLRKILCYRNCINKLPKLPDNLKFLDYSNNKLGHYLSVDKLPQSLELLDCSENGYDSIEEMFEVFIKINKKIEIQLLPSSLKVIRCHSNNFTPFILSQVYSLKNLERLYCSRNNISILPPLLSNLKELRCFENNLTQLPMLPDKLELYCDGNDFTIYPNLKVSTINTINRFRIAYYSRYAYKFFYSVLKKRMDKHRNELIKKAEDMHFRPSTIERLTIMYGITMNNTEVLYNVLNE